MEGTGSEIVCKSSLSMAATVKYDNIFIDFPIFNMMRVRVYAAFPVFSTHLHVV
jgi:hypothetical protein